MGCRIGVVGWLVILAFSISLLTTTTKINMNNAFEKRTSADAQRISERVRKFGNSRPVNSPFSQRD